MTGIWFEELCEWVADHGMRLRGWLMRILSLFQSTELPDVRYDPNLKYDDEDVFSAPESFVVDPEAW